MLVKKMGQAIISPHRQGFPFFLPVFMRWVIDDDDDDRYDHNALS